MTTDRDSPLERPYDLAIRGGLVLPMTVAREHFIGDVLIRDGRIEVITKKPLGDVQATRILDASGAAVLPGFVQGHFHVVQSLLRRQADQLG
jgi:5-methylthioadenosine/S-adenosylhomocysteine deaminase